MHTDAHPTCHQSAPITDGPHSNDKRICSPQASQCTCTCTSIVWDVERACTASSRAFIQCVSAGSRLEIMPVLAAQAQGGAALGGWRRRLCLKKLAYGGVAVMLCKHQGSPTLNRLAPVSPRLHITTHARVRRGSRWPESRKQHGWCGAGRRVRGGRFTSSSTRAHRS